ncbi:MAG: glycosyltransferase [Candidatus Bilamarchaeaceae archaeon]
MAKWHVVNWTNQLAIHQSALARAMCEMGWDVTIVVEETVSRDRQKIGWQIPDFGNAKIVLAPSLRDVDAVLAIRPENTIHLFGAGLEYFWGQYAFFRASRLNLKMGLMSEASDPDGWKSPFRWVKHTSRRILYERKIQFVLGMGELGVNWFKKCGYPAQKLFPFMYVVESDSLNEFVQQEDKLKLFTVLYAGQLISRKRVDLLMRAFAILPQNVAQLIVVGDGPERSRLQHLSQRLGIQDQILWTGPLPWMQVRRWMLQADVLVLPSRFDGWGAVVSEALLCGTPAICTDYCGAADLLRESWRGEVVPRNEVAALAQALQKRLEMGSVNDKLRKRIQNWAQCLTGQSAARYLSAIFDYIYTRGDRPIPPWYV